MTDQFICLNSKGRLSRSGNAEEIMGMVQAGLPAQIMFTIEPSPDGKGLQLHEVGRFEVVFKPTVGVSQAVPLGATQPAASHPAPAEVKAPAPTEVTKLGTRPEIVAPPAPQQLTFLPVTEPARSQSELLKERGLEQPPTKKRKRSKGKTPTIPYTTSAKTSADPDDLGPPPTAQPGTMTVTKIIKATPEEAAAASQFGKIN